MSDKMPKEIWAMTGSSYTHDGQVWYSGNKINSDDVKYIRADFHEINIETVRNQRDAAQSKLSKQLIKEHEEKEAALQRMKDLHRKERDYLLGRVEEIESALRVAKECIYNDFADDLDMALIEQALCGGAE